MKKLPVADLHGLDRVLPDFQFVERHHAVIEADPATVFAATEAVDLSDSLVARILMAIWRVPARLFLRNVSSRPMSVRDFIPLVRIPPELLIRGLVAGVGRRSWTPEQFTSHSGPGFKLVWGYRVRQVGDEACRIETETRVFCGDVSTKRWFSIYWIIIRPWSGLIRRDLLRIIRLRAEKAFHSNN